MMSMPAIQTFTELMPYDTIYQQMRALTESRDVNTPDTLWFLSHEPVFTQGQAGKAEHVLAPGNIPVVQSDRGGQVTYHGPGQLMIYALYDLKRLRSGLKPFMNGLLSSIVTLLAQYGIEAHTRADAPGVYVGEAKICSLGLRVRKGCTYHGMSFNVAMDLEPFNRINPCGFKALKMTQIQDFIPDITLARVIADLTPLLKTALSPDILCPLETASP